MPKTFQPEYLSYSQTGNFTKIVLDYVEGSKDLKEFYEHKVDLSGIKASIEQRKNTYTDRKLLADQLQIQYKNLKGCDKVEANIDRLYDENTFTICTAHQPNIFTGHLYFIYKILHTIKLAEELKKQLPEYNFVPVFFMGSEDADLDELDHAVVDGKKYKWETKQTGAVGRMLVDKNLIQVIDEISGRISVEKYGKKIIDLLKECFVKNTSIEQATFLLVHHLFKNYGLLVLLPGNAAYKKAMHSIFADDLFNNTPSEIVSKTSEKLSAKYKVQAHPREINLFYLKDNIRNRMVQVKERFFVHDTDLVFTKEELKNELDKYPDRFSPNVILRGLFQEIILPNIAFIGGGGELAYWLELKEMFAHYKVPFPVLILRNSFLIIEERVEKLVQKLNIKPAELFKGEQVLLNEIVKKQTKHSLNLESEIEQMQRVYSEIKKRVKDFDSSLNQHAEALETKTLKRLAALEKKMLRAEKRKSGDTKNQLSKVLNSLFPDGNL
ncbi:MAG: bacillithiol biosynthesis cysteine-adding enzyme BshC, partial [Bacteroidota bacterium]|nr:bacillithiol biosynthesis cysteine-adding enzyme BshC [Bacteroidota bacterium]